MKKTILFTFLVCLFISCGTQKSTISKRAKKSEPTEYEQKASLLEDVHQLLGNRNYPSALLNLDRMIALNVNDGDYTAQRYRGMVLQVMGEKDEANEMYQSIINATNSSAKEKRRAEQLMTINNEIKKPINRETEIVKDSVEFKDAIKVIENVPVFPGCESIAKEAQTKCMSQGVARHIMRTIDVEIAKVTNYTGFIRSYVNYKIDEDGNISEINATGKNKFLNLEAHRVMAQLPKVIPGSQDGKNVSVPYTVPIRFAVN
ncbi:MAG: energy transducer TonB [Nonlabens sp.]|uniref:energy transducer TonB n=1 Tax=Nonlabens sp. TaxID=1888209 RepID=UPI003EF34B44